MTLDTLLLVSLAMLIRYGVSLWPHSGEGSPPLFGDYEAQRHWQEVTVNLPISEWYNNTTDNDLLYWGLDYPPLTAYHSWVVGKVATFYDSTYTKLHTSRGFESVAHKLFMRLTVLVSDLLILFPAIFLFKDDRNHNMVVVSLLTYPGLIMIDHGHFQYNNMSLGLFLAAVASLLRRKDLLGSVLFVLALNYKQMELYHALPFFFYLLGLAVRETGMFRKISKLFFLAVTVLVTFSVIWSPFLLLGKEAVQQVLHRIFPFSRGLFEDKVANFWCALDVLVKLKQQLSIPQLAQLCLGSTFFLSLPSNLHLVASPSEKTFLLSLVNTAIVFFMFSFQVHEKSILLAAIPVCLLASQDLPPTSTTVIPWFLTISTFSMLPLLTKDGLLIPTISLSILFITLVSNLSDFWPAKEKFSKRSKSPLPVMPPTTTEMLTKLTMGISLMGCLALTVLSVSVPPPVRYPFLWPLLISVYSAVHFLLFLIYFHVLQFTGNKEETLKKTN